MRERQFSVLTCVTAVHVRSVAIVFAPTSHDIVHKVRLRHVHRGVDFHLQNNTVMGDLIY